MNLKIGDKVLWRGSWGAEPPREATVLELEAVRPGEKHGTPVQAMPWEHVRENRAVVTLDNGHWAYGDQLSPLEGANDNQRSA